MKFRDVIASGVIMDMSLAFLWHFSNIWRYGSHTIQEPSVPVLIMEIGGLVLIFLFGLWFYISAVLKLEGGKDEI